MRMNLKSIGNWFKETIANLLFWVAIGGILTAFMLGAFRYAAHTSMFQFEKAVIEGQKFLTEDAIHDVLKTAVDESLFSVNIENLQTNLSALEYVRAARVSRNFPSTLVVEIQERAPIAYLKCEDGRVVMDVTDTLLHVTENVRSYYTLPLVKGPFEKFSSERLIANPGTPEVKRVGGFLRHIQGWYPEYARRITEISVGADSIALVLNPQNTSIYLDQDNFKRQLQVLEKFEETIQGVRTLSDYLYVDLRVRGQVVVREK